MLKIYSHVRLLTDRFIADGVSTGATGYIIEVYDGDNYEVEFSGEGGITIAQVVAKACELEVIPDRPTDGVAVA